MEGLFIDDLVQLIWEQPGPGSQGVGGGSPSPICLAAACMCDRATLARRKERGQLGKQKSALAFPFFFNP